LLQKIIKLFKNLFTSIYFSFSKQSKPLITPFALIIYQRRCKMNVTKVVIGVVILAVAIWMFFGLADPTARYLGGGIVAIVGIVFLFLGLKKSGTGPAKPAKGKPAPEEELKKK